ncbi:23S rRNA (adenine(2030)-N(6))-methyltransferase RlmJ [Pontibacterium granulatum]|uniref:23S rRNA (adenine(2030)-N(6))-methyltransferase RlmJ n=1 Tax=Pontibacterium granulatum TaxID=2036029 RepID=UPI00249AE029|nr:23S rRNA (adenine(2030)-N(6))-methyltransferase RlmJ [Pontibacterium granulatum]MDI3326007.1 23S rRNA (adenine(2030)-N(6))-methyltransferase RlmJ [Pontibacterium granulatum]
MAHPLLGRELNMLSYRHSFHAGNHADVLKHTVQTLILEALKEKEKPFVYHDTHSGGGRYDLHSAHAEKTGEFEEGIGRIWQQDCAELLTPYLAAVREMNPGNTLQYYPGSPALAQHLCREQDRLLMTELHSSDFPRLQQVFRGDRRARVLQEEGYKQLKASLPPKERRGLVLIDPPYELKAEYAQLIKGVRDAVKRWATGVYAIWYPVVFRKDVRFIEQELKASGIRKILKIELCVKADTGARGMTGSGMIVINPPWKLEQQMRELLPWLTETLAQEDGAGYTLDWLVPE